MGNDSNNKGVIHMKKKNITKLLLLCLVIFSAYFTACSSKEVKKESSEKAETNVVNKDTTEKGADDKNPIATITLENGKSIKIELMPEAAPNTVRNFISLSNSGFYNGLTFHRIIPGFMIQGGDPKGNGTGGPDYSIFGEFNSNGFNNPLKHTRGVISMARSKDKNSAGSQFFIMHEDAPHLDNEYAAFGKVIEGMDVVDEIAKVETGTNDKPKTDVKISKITVDTFGVQYKPVNKINK